MLTSSPFDLGTNTSHSPTTNRVSLRSCNHLTRCFISVRSSRRISSSVAQASSPAGSASIPPAVAPGPGGGTPPELAGEDACATLEEKVGLPTGVLVTKEGERRPLT